MIRVVNVGMDLVPKRTRPPSRARLPEHNLVKTPVGYEVSFGSLACHLKIVKQPLDVAAAGEFQLPDWKSERSHTLSIAAIFDRTISAAWLRRIFSGQALPEHEFIERAVSNSDLWGG